MLIMTVWTLFKYRKQSKDKFFVLSLCMYPASYFLLMLGAVYFIQDENKEHRIYGYITKYFLPFNYLVMWTIELLMCFEMQLIRVKLTTDEPIAYAKKVRLWKFFRFFVLIMSACFNILQILLNEQINLNRAFDEEEGGRNRRTLKFIELEDSV